MDSWDRSSACAREPCRREISGRIAVCIRTARPQAREMDINSTSKEEAQTANESAELAPVSASQVAVMTETQSKMPMEQRHYSALAQMVVEVSQDHTQLRTFVYEYARIKLRKELYPQFLEGAWSEIEEQMRGLEDAIDRLEADYNQSTPLPFPSKSRLTIGDAKSRSTPMVGYLGTGGKTRFAAGARSLFSRTSENASLSVAYDEHTLAKRTFVAKQLQSRFWFRTHFLIAIAIGVALYAALDVKTLLDKSVLYWLQGPPHAPVATETQPVQEPVLALNEKQQQIARNEGSSQHANDFPIPTEYGAYAVVDGRLIELEQLSLRVPDPRVAISATITNPSHTHLPASPRQFVIFRKDLLDNTPERASVRVIAQVVRALTFEPNGAPKSSNVEQSWVIRNNSYPMRIGPLADNPEMIVVRSEFPDFLFPAGRYVLVLKGIGYDFTIDGPVIDSAHCLERTEALNAPIYSECPKS
jgi:hypothetical protein